MKKYNFFKVFATVSVILAVSFLHLIFITRITSLLKDIRKEELASKELEKKLISKKMELESKIDLSKIERRARKELHMEITQDMEYIKLK